MLTRSSSTSDQTTTSRCCLITGTRPQNFGKQQDQGINYKLQELGKNLLLRLRPGWLASSAFFEVKVAATPRRPSVHRAGSSSRALTTQRYDVDCHRLHQSFFFMVGCSACWWEDGTVCCCCWLALLTWNPENLSMCQLLWRINEKKDESCFCHAIHTGMIFTRCVHW